MKFTSQICTTKEQSKRLLALGLKKETADMAWVDNALTEDYEDWKVTPIEELDEYDIEKFNENGSVSIECYECSTIFYLDE